MIIKLQLKNTAKWFTWEIPVLIESNTNVKVKNSKSHFENFDNSVCVNAAGLADQDRMSVNKLKYYGETTQLTA